MEAMTAEELRINKQLLLEISQRKKERIEKMSPLNEYTSVLQEF